jgi:cation:H+ antiporter
LGFAVTALIIITGHAFAWSANQLAAIAGMGSTFVGTLLVAIATTLPELTVTVTAVRSGAFDLAAGNLFGSNAFNMTLLVALDVAYTDGPLLRALDPAHGITAAFAIVLMGIALMALVYRASRTSLIPRPAGLALIALYGLALWLLYARTVQA